MLNATETEQALRLLLEYKNDLEAAQRLAEYYKSERDSYREQLEAMKREANND